MRSIRPSVVNGGEVLILIPIYSSRLCPPTFAFKTKTLLQLRGITVSSLVIVISGNHSDFISSLT